MPDVFLCLPGPTNVIGLLLGPEGLAHRLAPGSVVIDTTTSTPTTDNEIIAALAERESTSRTHLSRAGSGEPGRHRNPDGRGGRPDFDRIKGLLLEVTPAVSTSDRSAPGTP